MPRTLAISNLLSDLLDQSLRPIYAVDGRRRIVYCNRALAAWLELKPEQIIGRLVEYHSEPADGDEKDDAAAPLADLSPPPQALAGEACQGTISCVARGGRLSHRHAEFVPLHNAESDRREKGRGGGGVLVLLSEHELSQQELTAEVTADPSADELHRTIRRFRRGQASRYAIESLLGESSPMQKVRAQIAAAAASGANVLIVGPPGSGRGHVARAIHYRATGEGAVRLVPVDCEIVTEDLLRRALDALRLPGDDPRHRPTLLLENLDRLDPAYQSQLAATIRHNSFRARVIATRSRHTDPAPGITGRRVPGAVADTMESVDGANDVIPARVDGTRSVPATINAALLDAVSTITIHVPRLSERIEDLPILAQCFLEACNRGSDKQVGSLRADALDQLALYVWPGELGELREAIAAAHAACMSHEVTPVDLPAIVHHASQSAVRTRKRPERIVLDELLAQIEREAIVRALAQAAGNKTEAAEFLGMTRPRLYRRMIQLDLASESKDSEPQLPEFIEQPPSDETT